MCSHLIITFTGAMFEWIIVRTRDAHSSWLNVLVGVTLAIELFIVLTLLFYATDLSHIIYYSRLKFIKKYL